MERTALFPGSFDPFTIGHYSIVTRALPLFDSIIIGVGHNSAKKSYFTIEQRIDWIRQTFMNEPKIQIQMFEGLTVDFCRSKNIKYILRGLRTSADFEFERAIGHMNRSMLDGLETVFFLTEPEHTFISSTIVREILRYGGDVSRFLPSEINQAIMQLKNL